MVIASFTLMYFAVQVRVARVAPLSVDEVFVAWMLRYFGPSHITAGLKLGLDTAPPAYYWLEGVATRLIRNPFLALRFPSILGFYVFALSIFTIVRKPTGLLIATFALFASLVSAAAPYALIARPYAIVLGCFGVACAAWVRVATGRNQTLCLFTTVASIVVALSVHFLAVYMIAALAIAEAGRTILNRRILWSYWLALAVGTLTLLAWLPVIAPIYRLTHASVHASGFYAKPTLGRLIADFFNVLIGTPAERPVLILALLAVPALLWATHTSHYKPSWLRGVDAHATMRGQVELLLLSLSALLLPFIAFLGSHFVTGSLNSRYFVEAVLGVMVLGCMGLNILPGGRILAGALLFICVMMFILAPQVTGVSEEARFLQAAPDDLPILVASASDFYTLHEEAGPPLSQRISFVGMPSGTSSPDPEPELIARNWKAAAPDLRIYTADEWFGRTPEFYLFYTSDAREGLTDWLLTHARCTFVKHDGSMWLFRVESSKGPAVL